MVGPGVSIVGLACTDICFKRDGLGRMSSHSEKKKQVQSAVLAHSPFGSINAVKAALGKGKGNQVEFKTLKSLYASYEEKGDRADKKKKNVMDIAEELEIIDEIVTVLAEQKELVESEAANIWGIGVASTSIDQQKSRDKFIFAAHKDPVFVETFIKSDLELERGKEYKRLLALQYKQGKKEMTQTEWYKLRMDFELNVGKAFLKNPLAETKDWGSDDKLKAVVVSVIKEVTSERKIVEKDYEKIQVFSDFFIWFKQEQIFFVCVGNESRIITQCSKRNRIKRIEGEKRKPKERNR